MSLFRYEAMNAKGRRKKGEVEADSERAACESLKLQGWVVRRLNIIEKSNVNAKIYGQGKRLKASEITVFLQQLSTLIGAGMPLVETIEVIAQGMERQRAQYVIISIRQHLMEGGSLADALRSQGFEDTICNMIAAGEETGQLESVAVRLADLLEHRQEVGQELLSATLYPAIILGFGLLVMLFLLAVVVPQIVTVFERTGGELPVLTKVVITLSTFLQHNGLYLIFVVLAVVFAYMTAMKRETFRYKRDQWLLAIPSLSLLLTKIETARFGRTLGMLLAGGVPALAAIHIANQSFMLLPMRKAGETAREILREGGSLADGLKACGYIPHLAIQLIRVGEQSGQLDRLLIRVAENYEREASQNMKRLLTVMEPALVLLMAVMVGALALAILLPIIEMNELVR